MPGIQSGTRVIRMTNDSGINQAAAAVLRGELAALDWTLEDLAEASGVPRVSVQRYLKGSRRMDLDMLATLASALGTDSVAVMSAAVACLDQPTPPRPTVTRSIPKTG